MRKLDWTAAVMCTPNCSQTFLYKIARPVVLQVLFCVLRVEVTYVVDRKVVYCGPRPQTQLEGRLSLPSSEHALLMGPNVLPWHHAVGLLEAADAPSAEQAGAAEPPES